MIVSPRPITNSSRSTRVIEELQENLEGIEKEIDHLRAQLQHARDNQEQFENDNQKNIQENQQLRRDITGITQLLESKQRVLEETKRMYSEGEARVKELKSEVTQARQRLAQENVRQKEVDQALLDLKAYHTRWRQQEQQLTDSIRQTQAGITHDLESDQAHHQELQQALARIRSLNLNQRTRLCLAQEDLSKEAVHLQQAIQENTHQFLNQVQKEFTALSHSLDTVDTLDASQIQSCLDAIQTLQSQIPHLSSA
ncbi:hypothetical protein BY458DRAFT_517548 [Sporodiniella umbellata]|nr:hypothetical protein BY458DRAFT_517548 [Sporodiniella umbellata]